MNAAERQRRNTQIVSSVVAGDDVNVVAKRWGVSPDTVRKVVWFAVKEEYQKPNIRKLFPARSKRMADDMKAFLRTLN